MFRLGRALFILEDGIFSISQELKIFLKIYLTDSDVITHVLNLKNNLWLRTIYKWGLTTCVTEQQHNLTTCIGPLFSFGSCTCASQSFFQHLHEIAPSVCVTGVLVNRQYFVSLSHILSVLYKIRYKLFGVYKYTLYRRSTAMPSQKGVRILLPNSVSKDKPS